MKVEEGKYGKNKGRKNKDGNEWKGLWKDNTRRL